MISWSRWFKFHHYLYLARHTDFTDKEAVENANAFEGFFCWLFRIRLVKESDGFHLRLMW